MVSGRFLAEGAISDGQIDHGQMRKPHIFQAKPSDGQTGELAI